MSTIRCTAELTTIGSWNVLVLPKSASDKLPSRGATAVEGRINDSPFTAVLEPDGKGSHWFQITAALGTAAGAQAGATVTLAMEPAKEWPEPEVPKDIRSGMHSVPEAQKMWKAITPAARWDWIRWIRATANADTRKRRIDVACSKMKAGERRPCCFNRNMCTEPAVSKSGILLEPETK